jgi:hypothetical protein
LAAVAWETIRSHRRYAAGGALTFLTLILIVPWIATVIVLLTFGAGTAVALAHSDLFGQRISEEDYEDWS